MSHYIREQAAEWVQTLRNDAQEHGEAFVDWVRSSPQHLHEFLLALALHQELAQVKWEKLAGVRELLASAATNVVRFPAAADKEPIHEEPSTSTAAPAMSPLLRKWNVAAAAAILLLAGVWWTAARHADTYKTDIGEQRTVELADGSIVNLNSRSRIDVRYTKHGRDVSMDGEALFKVARDAARPFRVYSGKILVQAVGTQFNVHRLPSGTTVSVIEGIVAIDTSPRGAVRLGAGEEVRVDSSGRLERRTVPDKTSLANWRQKRLVFRDNTLEDIVAEFNRWNRRQLRLEGGGADERYDGAFDADDPASLVAFIRRMPDLSVDDSGDRLIIKSRRP